MLNDKLARIIVISASPTELPSRIQNGDFNPLPVLGLGLNGSRHRLVDNGLLAMHRRATVLKVGNSHRRCERKHECLAQRRMALPNFTENRLGAVGPQPHISTTEMKAGFGSSDARSAALEKE